MQHYAKTQFIIDNLSFHPFTPTIRCNNIVFKNTGTQTIYIRTDPVDATTQDTLLPGDQEDLNFPNRHARDTAWRFDTGLNVLWAQASAGNGTMIVTQLE
jgi:hypothetical protein